MTSPGTGARTAVMRKASQVKTNGLTQKPETPEKIVDLSKEPVYQLVEVRTKDVMLGDRVYTLTELGSGQNKLWLTKFQEVFGGQASQVAGLAAKDYADGEELGTALEGLLASIYTMIDQAKDLLFAFSPEIAADREELEKEDKATDRQYMSAFQEACKLAAPFELSGIKNLLSKQVIGLVQTLIQSNLLFRNGGSASKKQED